MWTLLRMGATKFFFFWVFLALAKGSFPEKEPCEIIEPYGNVILKCENLVNKDQLRKAVEVLLNGRAMTELNIWNSSLQFIPHDLFLKSAVSRIKVKDSVLFYLFSRELENTAEAVTDIALENIDFRGGLDWSVLSNLNRLRTLSVSGSLLERIVDSVSELSLPVETMILVNDDIETIHDRAFQNFKDLKNLKLSNNKLTVFKRSMLPVPTSGLQFLDLSYNHLTSLPIDLFDNLKQLHSLILRGNQLQILEKSPIQTIFSSLFFFDVDGNPLRCDCELAWLLGEEKPFHLFGQCSAKEVQALKNLAELSNDDFLDCQR